MVERSGGLLFASQFTLFARTVKGTKPDFHLAMAPAQVCCVSVCTGSLCLCSLPLHRASRLFLQAQDFYASFVERMRAAYVSDRVHDGIFGAGIRSLRSLARQKHSALPSGKS